MITNTSKIGRYVITASAICDVIATISGYKCDMMTASSRILSSSEIPEAVLCDTSVCDTRESVSI